MLRDSSQTLMGGGGLMQKKFRPPPSDLKKFQGPLFAMKIAVKPIEKHVNSFFAGKFVVFFSIPSF